MALLATFREKLAWQWQSRRSSNNLKYRDSSIDNTRDSYSSGDNNANDYQHGNNL
jgi:hypothetical protein